MFTEIGILLVQQLWTWQSWNTHQCSRNHSQWHAGISYQSHVKWSSNTKALIKGKTLFVPTVMKKKDCLKQLTHFQLNIRKSAYCINTTLTARELGSWSNNIHTLNYWGKLIKFLTFEMNKMLQGTATKGKSCQHITSRPRMLNF